MIFRVAYELPTFTVYIGKVRITSTHTGMLPSSCPYTAMLSGSCLHFGQELAVINDKSFIPFAILFERED